MYVVIGARPHLLANPDEILQGGGHKGSEIPTAPQIVGSQFQKGCSGSFNRGIILFFMSS